ncbi:phage tail tape measure protein [Erwiniaceae bacterium CAU 1747]
MSNNLRLQVILGAVDKLTRPFKNAQASSRELANALKASKDRLKALNDQTARVDGFRKLRSQLEGAGSDLAAARLKVVALAREFAAASNPTKKQAKELEQAKRQAAQLKRTFHNLQRSVQRQRNELNSAGINTRQLSAAQRRLRTDTQSTTASIERQQAELRKLGERQQKMSAIRSRYEKTQALRGRIAGAGVSMVAQGGAALMGIRSTVNEASRYDMELAGFKALGVGDKTLSEADKFARGMNIIGNSATDNLKTLKEAHAVLRDFHEAKIVAPELARLQYATRFMSSHGVSDDAAENLRDQSPAVLKIAELRNQINNPDDFKKSVNMSAQAMAASGGMVLPDDYLAMMKTGGIAAKQLDNKAFYFSMSHIIQQIGGQRAGTQLSSAYQNLMMGRTTQGAATELMDLGLLDKNAVEYGKTGHIKKIKPGALTNKDLYLNDPFSYLMQEIVPRIQKKHPKLDERGMETAIAKLFSNRTAGDLFVTMFRERANINKQIQAGQDAYSVDQLVEAGKKTAQGQTLDLESKKRDLYLQMGQDILPLYVSMLEKLSSVISRVTAFMRKHASAAKAVMVVLAGFALLATVFGTLALAAAAILGPLAAIRFGLSTLGVKTLPSVVASLKRTGGVLSWMAGSPLALLKAGMFGIRNVIGMAINPMAALRSGLSAAGGVMKFLESGPMALLRVALYSISGLLGALLSPIGLVVAALAAVALVIWKYWQPISAFLSGVVEGFSAAAAPISAAFEPLRPVFQWIGDKVQALWGWFNDLLTPVKSTAEELNNATAMGRRFGEALADGLNMVMHPLESLKSGVSWLLEKLGIVSEEASKAKLPQQVTRQQFATVNNDGRVSLPPGGFPPMGFAGMYDSGGTIPRGQFGIVGENGPEIVNGPANVTSRLRTAALASVVAGFMGNAAAPAEAAPLHPFSLPALVYKQSQPAKSASLPPVIHCEINAPIHITAQPGQSAQDIAREVARQLDARERKAMARARSNFSDQGGYES